MTRNHLPNLKFKLGTGNFFDERNIGRLDAYANRALELIDNAFGRKAWPSPQASVPAQPIGATTPPPLSIVTGPGSQPGSQPGASGGRNDELIDLLKTRPILKLIGELNKHQDRETLEDLVGDSSNTGLFYQVEEALEDQHGTFNQQSILNRKSIVLYLFVYAQRVEGLSEPAAIARWIADDEDGGIREIYRAVVDLAVRDLVQRKRIEVGVRAEFDTYARLQIENSQFSFLDGVFEKSIENLVKDYAFDNNNFKLIDDTAAKLGILLSTTQRQFLNNYIKNSTILINAGNAEHFLPIALNQFSNRGISFKGNTTNESPLDFSVDYYDDVQEALAINAENIRAAAQLYYVMTLADELGLFDAADLLITKYLASGQVDIRNPDTLAAVQQYAFSEEFTDLKSGRVFKRTQPEERRMFYRQVFYLGDGDVMDGAVSNTEFEQVWYNLMNEVAHYIQQLGESENPVAFVSRQYVAQTIDDLRYNLSNHCTGLAKAISPIIQKELDFVVNRFFQDEEIVQQLALHNSKSFWKVPERILQDRDGRAVNLTRAKDKARLGHILISLAADFTPAMVENDGQFSQFISAVQAFIVASSNLEREESQRRRSDMPEDEFAPAGTGQNGVADDDWDF